MIPETGLIRPNDRSELRRSNNSQVFRNDESSTTAKRSTDSIPSSGAKRLKKKKSFTDTEDFENALVRPNDRSELRRSNNSQVFRNDESSTTAKRSTDSIPSSGAKRLKKKRSFSDTDDYETGLIRPNDRSELRSTKNLQVIGRNDESQSQVHTSNSSVIRGNDGSQKSVPSKSTTDAVLANSNETALQAQGNYVTFLQQ